MKNFALVGLFAFVAATGLLGCSWDSGSDADSWSSSFEWVNFSGVYRAADDSILTQTTTQESTESTTGPGAGSVPSNERPTAPGTANGSGISRISASGNLSPGNIEPLSVSITLYAANGNLHSSYKDDGNGNLVGGIAPGVIIYKYGSWSVDFSSSMGAPEGGTWKATYRYYTDDGSVKPLPGNDTATTTTTGSSTTSTRTTATAVYFYNVVHKAQYITMSDDNGLSYSGRISKMQSTSGAQNTDIGQVAGDEQGNDGMHAKYTYYESPLPANGDQVVATFECSGPGGKIVGTLSGLVDVGVIKERRLDATLITGATADDINAVAPAVAITVAAAPAGTETVTTPSTTTED